MTNLHSSICTSQFVNKTLNEEDYQIWLTQEDIAKIAEIKYNWCGDDGSIIFQVVGAIEQLGFLLDKYKESLEPPGKQSLTLIINLRGNHWVTLVITLNNNLCAYYIDSLGNEINGKVKSELRSKIPGVSIVDLKFKQQEDDYNCGILA